MRVIGLLALSVSPQGRPSEAVKMLTAENCAVCHSPPGMRAR